MDPSVDTIKRYQRYFKKLIELERLEEISYHLTEIHSISGFQREKRGRAILNLSTKDQGRGLGGIYLVRLSREGGMPDTEIGVGDLVIISTGKPSGEEAQAVVTEKTNYYVTVAYNNPPPHYVYKKKVRLDLFANDLTFQRMKAALFSLKEHQVISDLLLGNRKPRLKEEDQEIVFQQPLLNSFQREAVSSSLKAMDVFLIHGPPGTGKTTTLVESILQHVKKGQKILATADSNTAVDNIVEKLVELKCRVVRIGNPARMNERIAQVSLDQMVEDNPDFQQAASLRDVISEIKEEQHKYIRPHGQARRGLSDDQILKLSRKGATSRGIQLSKIHNMAQWIQLQQQINGLLEESKILEKKAVKHILANAEVICSTNSSSGNELLANQKYDVVFIDEATQSMEPSCLIPMVKGSKWILAGDHKQLPPTVLSDEARDLHFTLFERWIKLFESTHNGLLKIQYRMHKDIMSFSNKTFYDGQLVASPKVKNHHIGQLSGFSIPDTLNGRYREILDPALPLCFINTGNGTEARIEGSFSYYNKAEAGIVVQLTQYLMACRLFPDDLGIISPYEQQVNNIRSRLVGSGIEIKTVDGFQGREKEIMIISFVRSNPNGQLGFLTDYRRLNVALTRARRKLILVGHLPTLQNNKIYDQLIKSIKPVFDLVL